MQHNPNPNALGKISHQVMQEVEKFDAGTLLSPLYFLPGKDAEKEEIQKLIIDVNQAFEFFSSDLRYEIIADYQECNKLYEGLNSDNADTQLRLIIQIQTEISNKALQLRQIQKILDAKNLEKIAKEKFPNNATQQKAAVMELRFSHLNAAKLAMFSDIVAVAYDYLNKQIQKLESNNEISGHLNEIKKIREQLFDVQQGIVDSMKARILIENSQAQKTLQISNLTTSQVEIGKSWQETQHVAATLDNNSIDKTYSQGFPKLPINKESEFESIREYYLFYIAKVGKDLTWAKINDYEDKPTLTERVFSYLNPQINPYAGLTLDAWNLLNDNYLKPSINAINDMVVSIYDYWLADKISAANERLQANENFQKIQLDLDNKKQLIQKEFEKVYDNFQKLAAGFFSYYQKAEDKEKAIENYKKTVQQLMDDWTTISVRTGLEEEIAKLQEDVSVMQAKLEKEIEEYNQLCSSFVDVSESKHQVVSVAPKFDPMRIVFMGADVESLTMALEAVGKGYNVVINEMNFSFEQKIILDKATRKYLLSIAGEAHQKELKNLFACGKSYVNNESIDLNEIVISHAALETILLKQLQLLSETKQIVFCKDKSRENIDTEFPSGKIVNAMPLSLNKPTKDQITLKSGEKVIGIAQPSVTQVSNQSLEIFVSRAALIQDLLPNSISASRFSNNQAFTDYLKDQNFDKFTSRMNSALNGRIEHLSEQGTLMEKLEGVQNNLKKKLSLLLRKEKSRGLFSEKRNTILVEDKKIALGIQKELTNLDKQFLEPDVTFRQLKEIIDQAQAALFKMYKDQHISKKIEKDELYQILISARGGLLVHSIDKEFTLIESENSLGMNNRH